jgi:glycosyltransferase involved in cell wall biosynthesis
LPISGSRSGSAGVDDIACSWFSCLKTSDKRLTVAGRRTGGLSSEISAAEIGYTAVRIHFILPGLHRVRRGAEMAFESVAAEIAKLGLDTVTVVGSGEPIPGRPYEFRHVGLVARERFERWPKFPPFRSEYIYEEAIWAANYLATYRPGAADITVTCSYPFVNWLLTRWPPFAKKPAHVFVTQNGDWPAQSDNSEYRFFRCDGLVCTNPEFYARNSARWPCLLVPNGIDPQRFFPGPGDRARFGLPASGPIVLMVSALIDSKRVLEGMRAVARIPDAFLVVAGDGPLRDKFDALGNEIMPGRFRRLTLPAEQMPDLYRCADVMLHPTFHESFGNVYVEAMAVGVPVVAHDYDVTRWIFDDHPGLVNAADEAALVAGLQWAIRDGRADAAARTAVAAERFAWSSIARLYRDFFVEVDRRHRGASA